MIIGAAYEEKGAPRDSRIEFINAILPPPTSFSRINRSRRRGFADDLSPIIHWCVAGSALPRNDTVATGHVTRDQGGNRTKKAYRAHRWSRCKSRFPDDTPFHFCFFFFLLRWLCRIKWSRLRPIDRLPLNPISLQIVWRWGALSAIVPLRDFTRLTGLCRVLRRPQFRPAASMKKRTEASSKQQKDKTIPFAWWWRMVLFALHKTLQKLFLLAIQKSAPALCMSQASKINGYYKIPMRNSGRAHRSPICRLYGVAQR